MQCLMKIGFGILAAVPETSTVYPLLGRPHDSLSRRTDSGYISLVGDES